MRKHLLPILFLNCLYGALYAQSSSEAMPIALAYMDAELSAGLEAAPRNRLATKVLRIGDRYGFIAADSGADFGLYPRFDVIESVEMSGMRKMQAVQAEFTLHVKQLNNGLVLGSMSRIVSGSGSSASRALLSAINEIPTSGEDYQRFIRGVRKKLNDYYAENCQLILSKADGHYQVGKYARAVSDLLQVPAEAEQCQRRVKAKLREYYLAFQEQYCAELLQAAKAKIAAADYDKGLEIIALIDPASPCKREAEGVLSKVENKVSQERERQFSLLQQVYADKVELERYRIEAMREIGKAYYAALAQPGHWAGQIIVVD